MNFKPIFILFIFYFFIFFPKNFFIFEIFENVIPDSKRKYSHTIFKNTNRFELAHQMAGRGGAKPPRLPSVIKKMWVAVGHMTRLQIV